MVPTHGECAETGNRLALPRPSVQNHKVRCDGPRFVRRLPACNATPHHRPHVPLLPPVSVDRTRGRAGDLRCGVGCRTGGRGGRGVLRTLRTAAVGAALLRLPRDGETGIGLAARLATKRFAGRQQRRGNRSRRTGAEPVAGGSWLRRRHSDAAQGQTGRRRNRSPPPLGRAGGTLAGGCCERRPQHAGTHAAGAVRSLVVAADSPAAPAPGQEHRLAAQRHRPFRPGPLGIRRHDARPAGRPPHAAAAGVVRFDRTAADLRPSAGL